MIAMSTTTLGVFSAGTEKDENLLKLKVSDLNITKEDCICLQFFLIPTIIDMINNKGITINEVKYAKAIDYFKIRYLVNPLNWPSTLHIILAMSCNYAMNCNDRDKIIKILPNIRDTIVNGISNIDKLFVMIGVTVADCIEIVINTVSDEICLHDMIAIAEKTYIKYEFYNKKLLEEAVL